MTWTLLSLPLLAALNPEGGLPAPMDLAAARLAVSEPDSAVVVWVHRDSPDYEAVLRGESLEHAARVIGRRALRVFVPPGDQIRKCECCIWLIVRFHAGETELNVRVDGCCKAMRTDIDGRPIRWGYYMSNTPIERLIEEVVLPAPGD